MEQVPATKLGNGKVLSRARELAALYLKAPEVTRRNSRIHFIQPLKERILREERSCQRYHKASAVEVASTIAALAVTQQAEGLTNRLYD